VCGGEPLNIASVRTDSYPNDRLRAPYAHGLRETQMRKKLLLTALGGTASLLLFAPTASAQENDPSTMLPSDLREQFEPEQLFDLLVPLDNAFVLLCGALVVFMQAGFAMVEAGLTRAKNAAHMMLKNLLDFAVGATGFAVIGYHIAFSESKYFGWEWLWSSPTANAPAVGAQSLTTPIHFFFNMAFVAAASTIVSGAVAERVKFRAYFIYAIVISAFIYPVVVGWVWGPAGWLADTGFVDFAGSTVVHVTGGMCALTGAKIIGPRIGRFAEDGTPTPIPGHNVPLAVLGVFILLIGWFGFNAGSIGTADLAIGAVIAATSVSAGAGAMGALVTSMLAVKAPDVTLIGNGLLGGLVAISAGALDVDPAGALAIGFVAGVIATLGVLALDRFRIDDPVGAIPVHLFCSGLPGYMMVLMNAWCSSSAAS